ncbi:DUF3160 domain-containing protein [Acetivibrio mesophilus]|uniref:DUF3160 domain-containing protein n=2 Tax=Acetivibrio mesophilus TaxID=2487273 RepID=A0A4Q0I9E1_9FIRM|nr:DUF3160 domain-containing protein [Acetivibrio mesophilus]
MGNLCFKRWGAQSEKRLEEEIIMLGKRVLCLALALFLFAGTVGCSNKNETDLPKETPYTTEEKSPDNTQNSLETVFKPSFIDERDRNYSTLEWSPINYEKKVKPYKINKDLSNIKNIDQFGEFTPEQKELITKNGFVVVNSNEEQLFYIYERNEYLKIPSFVTTDSVLQVYHLFFDYSLRILEYEKLMDPLNQLTSNMILKSNDLYKATKDEKLKELLIKNIAYFTVAQKALGLENSIQIPDEAKRLAESEYQLIEKAEGTSKSPIFGFELDYSQYIPRGHYTRNEEFEKYFKAMMWYGQAPFPIYKRGSGNEELDLDSVMRVLLITYCAFSDVDGVNNIELWEKIYDPTVFYVGSTDDLNLYHLKDLIIKVYGDEPDIEKFLNKEYIDKLNAEAKNLPSPRIQAKYTSTDTPTDIQFRFMGQRYIPDSEILQSLVEPYKRPFPKGLDVMGVLGSERAYDLLINRYKENETWSDYSKEFNKLKGNFSKISNDTWQSNMYYGWLWTLKPLIRQFGEGYPSFMTNTAWEDKSLSTALGSWSQLRHDTVLYAKPSGAECGGGEEPPVVKGYVEPNIEVYERLLWLTRFSRMNLTEKEILPDELKNKMQHFEDLLEFLITCSVKELRNEELSKEEYYQLLIYGGTLEYISTSLVEGYKSWYEITSETDRNMALVVDVHTAYGNCLEVGVGPASQIFVAVPIGDEIYLTRGAVFSYYEFVNDKRLTTEEWQNMIKESRQPAQPDWTDSFINGEKLEIPVPLEPYSSGC